MSNTENKTTDTTQEAAQDAVDDYKDWKTEDFVKEIQKLRKENAKRRTDFRDFQEESKKQYEGLQGKFDTLTKNYENVTSQLNAQPVVSVDTVEQLKKEYEGKQTDLLGQVEKLQKDIAREKVLRTAFNKLYENGYQFRNAQERIGFETSILQAKDDGNFKSSEEVIREVEQFLKDNFQPAKIPPVGPGARQIDPATEIARLLNKPKPTQEDIKRIKDLEAMIENRSQTLR